MRSRKTRVFLNLYIRHRQVCFFFAHENLGPQLTLYYSNSKRMSSCVVSQISNNAFSSNWHIRTMQKSLAIYFLRVYCVAPNNLKRRDRSSENRIADSQAMERRARLPLRHRFNQSRSRASLFPLNSSSPVVVSVSPFATMDRLPC